MKICKNCGTSNSEESRFCVKCGQELTIQLEKQPEETQKPVDTQQPVQSQSPVFNQQPVPSPYTYAPYPVQSNPNIMQNLRDMLASPLLLTLAIIWIVKIAVSVISGSAIFSQTNNSLINGFSRATYGISFSFTSFIPSIFIIIGLLLLYSSAKNQNRPLSTTGISMIRVVSIILLVLTCIAVAIMLIVSIALLIGGSGLAGQLLAYFDFGNLPGLENGQFDVNDMIGIFGIIMIILVAIIGTLSIVFLTSLVKFTSSVKQTMITGMSSAKGASAFSAFCFILGGFSALSIFPVFASLNSSMVIFSFLETASGSAIYILLGIIAMKYKQTVTGLY